MSKRHTYKSTQKHASKTAQRKDYRRRCRLNAKTIDVSEVQRQLTIQARLSYMNLVLSYLEDIYGISEMEMLFGSNDLSRQSRIEVVRAYLAEIYSRGENPSIDGLEDAFDSAALEAYCSVKGIDLGTLGSIANTGAMDDLLAEASEYMYGYLPVNQEIVVEEKLSEEAKMASSAKTNLENFKNDLRRGTADSRNAKRANIVKTILQNLSLPVDERKSNLQLAKEVDINRNTMNKYVCIIKFMLENNMTITENVLNEKKRGRKGNKYTVISEDAYHKLLVAMDGTPDEFKLKFSTWTAEALQVYLKVFCDIEVSKKYLYNFLAAHEIVSKVASRKNPKADPEEVEAFKKSIFAKFKAAILRGEIVVFLDETHVQQGSKNYGYAPKGRKSYYSYTTEALHCGHTILSIIGFDFTLSFQIKGSVDTKKYITCLQILTSKYPDRNFLIFRDNARIHVSKELDEFLSTSEVGKRVRFEALPKYSPELNPVELLNNEYKGTLKKVTCRSKEQVLEQSRKFFRYFQDENGNSTLEGRRKSRQYMKGGDCAIYYQEFLRATLSVRQEKAQQKASNRVTVAA